MPHGDDVDLCCLQVLQVGAVAQVRGALQVFGAAFQGVVLPVLQFIDAGLVDVKPERGAVFAKFNGQGQADVAQADDGDGFVFLFLHDAELKRNLVCRLCAA